ncbi:MAG: hypothetical protein SFV17_09960 [Candidatus Obscuribacter sp.]|nr:hypothetical protein [Candidatus Obscuribacter sp.]
MQNISDFVALFGETTVLQLLSRQSALSDGVDATTGSIAERCRLLEPGLAQSGCGKYGV